MSYEKIEFKNPVRQAWDLLLDPGIEISEEKRKEIIELLDRGMVLEKIGHEKAVKKDLIRMLKNG